MKERRNKAGDERNGLFSLFFRRKIMNKGKKTEAKKKKLKEKKMSPPPPPSCVEIVQVAFSFVSSKRS